MKVKQLKINSFRGIKDLTLDFNLNEPTVFIGINGVGKSSILDCLAILLSWFNVCVQDLHKQGSYFTDSDINNQSKENRHKKAEWYEENLMVSPLDNNCADFFRYTDDGQILPTQDLTKQPAAKETINRLALDINKLRRMRQGAIEGILDVIDTLNNNEIRNLIDGFEKPNKNGEYEQFCSAIVYVLKQYL